MSRHMHGTEIGVRISAKGGIEIRTRLGSSYIGPGLTAFPGDIDFGLFK